MDSLKVANKKVNGTVAGVAWCGRILWWATGTDDQVECQKLSGDGDPALSDCLAAANF